MKNDDFISGYDPLKDPEYMSPHMIRYFEHMLNKMLDDILNKENAISLSLVDNPTKEPDHVDQGALENLHNNEFSYQEHENKMRHEIEAALQRIHHHTYGYCEKTGEPIGVKRLLIAPQARYCLKMQKEIEK